MKTTSTKNIGKVYGQLKVVGIERDYDMKRTFFMCDCLACGKKRVKFFRDNVISGRTCTCGCKKGTIGRTFSKNKV